MDGFGYGDIIVIGALAAFILLRYRAMLGEKNERDDAPRANPQPLAEYERVVQLPTTRIPPASDKKDALENYGSLAETLGKMRAIDRDFSADEFVAGARAAYEMVIDAYNTSDRDTLKILLSDALYQNFDAALTAEKTDNRRNETTLVAIKKAVLADATLSNQLATLTVDFVSEQIHLVRNEANEIIEGNPSAHSEVEERWVFTRTLSNPNPNWTIIET
jgi:predicted lipid-binding transport protein (Tim44 family)